jgi:transposase-like protein
MPYFRFDLLGASICLEAYGPNRRQAAREAGISESTLYRWLQDEHFRVELNRLTAKIADQPLLGL